MRNKFHETEIEPGLRNTVRDPSSIAMKLVSQVIIADDKVPDAKIITDIEEYFLKVGTKMYPLAGPSRPNRYIRMSTYLTLMRDSR